MTGEMVEQAPPDTGSGDPTEDSTAPPPTFDLSKKKKKKKQKSTDPEAADLTTADGTELRDVTDNSLDPSTVPVPEDEPMDFALPNFAGKKKKKKKKKVVFDDDFEADAQEGGDDSQPLERASRREFPPQPWDNSSRDYSYSELINRAFQFLHGKNPSLASGGSQRRRVSVQLPQVAREGTKKTVFLNFGAICKSIHRQQDHLLAYMGAELGTTGNIQEGGRLVIKGRFGAEGIANVLKRYMLEYVICTSCRSPDTVLMRDANTRLYFVSCESCGAKRSVTPIRQGFMARVERRKK